MTASRIVFSLFERFRTERRSTTSRRHWYTMSGGRGRNKKRRPRERAALFRGSEYVGVSERQRLDLLDLRQGLRLVEQIGRHCAVDLDQRDGIGARRDAAEMEGRDVDLGIAEQARELADEARLVLVGYVDYRLAEFGVDADPLDVDQARLAVGIDRARD